jgi:hypothetical protein
MLILEAATRSFQSLPRLLRAGAWVFAVALLVDVALHVLGGDPADAHPGHTGPEMLAHEAVFVGMVLIMAGVVREGARRPAQASRSSLRPPGRVAGAAGAQEHEEQRDAVR